MANIFTQKIPIFKPRRGTFDYSHSNHLTSKLGKVTPFCCIPTDAGDKYRMAINALGRTHPLRVPVMAHLNTKFAWYHVSARNICNCWEKWYTSAGGLSLKDSLPPELPQATPQQLHDLGFPVCPSLPYQIYDDKGELIHDGMGWYGTLFDYLDFPHCSELNTKLSNKPLSLLPLIAYNYAWSCWMRNQNIQDELDIESIRTFEGSISTWTEEQIATFKRFTNYCCLRDINWNKDYFTSAQPYTQKGVQVVVPLKVTLEDFMLRIQNTIPGGMNAVVQGAQKDLAVSQLGVYLPSPASQGGSSDPINQVRTTNSSGVDQTWRPLSDFAASSNIDGKDVPVRRKDNMSSTKILLSAVRADGSLYEFDSGLTINDLRVSSAAQELLEDMARGGTRLVEHLLVQHGVKLSDKTAQRAEFLGGSSLPIQIGEVAQTSQDLADENPLGKLGGTSYTRGAAAGSKYYVELPGYLFGLMWTKCRTSYMWGVPRHWYELDVLQKLNPHFVHLGEQEVYDYEVMCTPPDDPDRVFGYMQRYDHLRSQVSRVHGEMRTTLSEWHLARNNIHEELNEDFIKAQVPLRAFYVQDNKEDQLIHHLVIHMKVKKNLPRHSRPKLI